MPKPLDIAGLNISTDEIHQLMDLCPGSQILVYSDGEYIFREHEPGEAIYLIIDGAFNVEQGGGAQPLTTIASHWNRENEPCFVGEMAYFGNGRRTASIRCSGTTYALELAPEHLGIILEKSPSFTQILCRQFTVRLKEANDTLKKLTDADHLEVNHINIEAGEEIITQGAPADTLYMVLFGQLQWQRDGQIVDSETVMEFIEPAAYLTGGCYRHSVIARELTMLAAISSDYKESVIRNYPQMILQLIEQQQL